VTAEPIAIGVQKPSALLEPSSQTIDLGLVPQAGSERETFELTNPGSEPVTVARISSSCECLKLRPAPPFTVPPGRSLAVTAELDLSAEPQFAGGLSITVTGYTPEGERAFEITVSAAVKPGHMCKWEEPAGGADRLSTGNKVLRTGRG